MAPYFSKGTGMRTRAYDVQKRRALRKAGRIRARVMKAFLRMARGAVAKAAHDASVGFYEAAGVRIRGQSPI